MEAKELRNLSHQELLVKLNDLKAQLYKFRYQIHTGKVEKPHKIKDARHTIARINTIIREQKWQKKPTEKSK